MFLSQGVHLYSQNTYQQLNNYAPSDSLITYLSGKLKNPGYTSKNHKLVKELKKVFVKRSDYLKELQEKQLLMQNDPITNFIQEVANTVLRKSSDTTVSSFYIFTVRDVEINAFSMGSGIILVNISLLERLNSWEELAFIIGHEMGHDILNHAITSSEKQVLLLTDKKIKTKAKKAAKQEYGNYTALSNVYYELISQTSLHSRENELQSDSIGQIFANKLEVGLKGAINALSTLDSADYLLPSKKFDLVSLFSSESFSFNPEWMKSNNASDSWGVNEASYEYPDSLKTHPNIKERKAHVLTLSSTTAENENGSYLNLTEAFERLKKTMQIESVIAQIESGFYSMSLYNAIVLKEKYPEEPFVDYLISHSLLEVIIALKNQNFNAHVPFPDKRYPKEYNKVLHFLHNSNSSRMIMVYNNYCLTHLLDESLLSYKNFLDAYYKFYIEQNADKELLNYNYQNYYQQKVIKTIKSQLAKK